MSRKTRTAWLVVDAQGVIAGFSSGEVGLAKARDVKRHARWRWPGLPAAQLVRVTYLWPPAKKRRNK